MVETEIEAHLSVDHPQIAKLLDIYQSGNCLHLVMECLEGGDLFVAIQDRMERTQKAYSEEETIDAMRQILLALHYLHTQGFVHRDVKLENLCYACDGALKLIDFGFCTTWDEAIGERLTKGCGTLSYIAPELLARCYTNKVDMWSAGVVAYMLLSGRQPFYGNDRAQMASIQAGRYSMSSERWSNISVDAKSFIRSLLEVDPMKRLSAREALDHPFMRSSRARLPTPPGPEIMWEGRKIIANGKKGEVVAHDSGELSSMLNIKFIDGTADWFKLEDLQFDSKEAEVARSICQFSRHSAFRQNCMRSIALSLPHNALTKASAHFSALDVNQEGVIKLSDMHQFLTELLPESKPSQTEQATQALDYNCDQTIHYSDFVTALVGTVIDFDERCLAHALRDFGKVIHRGSTEDLSDTSDLDEFVKFLADVGCPDFLSNYSIDAPDGLKRVPSAEGNIDWEGCLYDKVLRSFLPEKLKFLAGCAPFIFS